MNVDLEKVVRDYLPQVIHMSLGTSKDGKPWVCEVHFAYDDNLNLYFRSLPSTRHGQDIAASPSVAGNIVKQHVPGQEPLGVYFGGAAELTTGEGQIEAFKHYDKRFNRGPGLLEEAQKDPGNPQLYKITVANWYAFGRLDDKGVRKHQLTWNGGKK